MAEFGDYFDKWRPGFDIQGTPFTSLQTNLGQWTSTYGYATWPGTPLTRDTPYLPVEGWDPYAKTVAADILSTVGYGDFEQGLFDRPVPDVPTVLSGSGGWWPAQIPATYPGSLPVPTSAEAEVAIDWGGIITGLGSQYIQAQYAPQPQFVSSFVDPTVVGPAPAGNVGGPNGITWGNGGGGGGVTSSELCGAGPCSSPRYLTYDCRTQTFSKKRRRRRGRLLTASDQHDLGVIVAMFGKGAAGQIALAAAVKR